MTIAPSQQIDASLMRWYRCMTRCVRRELLRSSGLDGSWGFSSQKQAKQS
jgi:hypothetical protein